MRKSYKLFAVFVAIAAVAFWMQAPESFASGNQASGSTAKVDLNSASAKDLETLPGVGEATAKKIIAGRPYSSTSDLSKAGVSAATIKKITPLVTFGGAAPASAPAASKSAASKSSAAAKSAAPAADGAPIDLNNASAKDLETLPGVGEATAKKIISGRPYSSTSDLSKAGVSAATIKKITPLVTVGSAPAAAATPAPAPQPTSSASKRRSSSAAASESTAPAVAPASSSPAPAPAPAPAASAPPAAPAAAAHTSPQAQPPPGSGMVWVNLDSGVYHKEGTRYYGKTKNGKYMSEADAIKAGYRAAKNE